MRYTSNPTAIADQMDEEGAEEASVTAPTAPPRTTPKPKTVPTPNKPKKNPFTVPRPTVVPAPQNIFVALMESYEDEAHPNNQRFWRGIRGDKSHAFSKHPIFAIYGNDLSKSAFEHTAARTAKVNADPNQMMQVAHRIMTIESRHRNPLQELAKDIVSKIWNFPRERLDAMLTTDVEINNSSDQNQGQEQEEQTPATLVPEINKRLTLNALSHGSAVHNMMELHHLVRDQLGRIDGNLVRLYDQIASASHKQYWLFDIAAFMETLANMAAGSARVDWESSEQDEEPIVVARAVCFPVLVQELCKGIMMMLNAHGLQGHDEVATKHILRNADDIKHEPWLIQVGPELWRRFLKVMNAAKVPHAEVMAALAQKTPEEVHNIIMAILDNKANAQQLIQGLVQEEPEEVQEWTPESDQENQDIEEEPEDPQEL